MMASMESFQVGDVVQLKSGGPLMTVQSISVPGFVECVWFPIFAGSSLQKEVFLSSSLKRSVSPT